MKQNLEKLIKFFKYDLQVKKVLDDCAPKQEYLNDSEKYNKILSNSIETMEYYIDCMLDLFPIEGSKESKPFFENLKLHLDRCNCDFDKLSDFYRKFISEMRDKLIADVADRCVGHTLYNRWVDLKEANTVNEMLHIIHQSVTNNEEIYCKMPKIYSKKNIEGNDINLYGENSGLAIHIYNSFPVDFLSDQIDIVSFNGQFLIMVRDVGHALAIEVSKNVNDNTYFVNYFIPKICNVDMVNNLRGVSKINENSKYTRGVFRVEIDELAFAIVDLVQKVPTDADIIRRNDEYYNNIVKR